MSTLPRFLVPLLTDHAADRRLSKVINSLKQWFSVRLFGLSLLALATTGLTDLTGLHAQELDLNPSDDLEFTLEDQSQTEQQGQKAKIRGKVPATVLPEVIEHFGPQQYLRMRWHGPVSMDEPMDVTLCFDEAGQFKRGWAWTEAYNRLEYYPSNRHDMEHVERDLKAANLTLQANGLKGELEIQFREKVYSPYSLSVMVKNGVVSGIWQMPIGTADGEEELLPQAFSGQVSGDTIQLSLPKGARSPRRLKESKYTADSFNATLAKNANGEWQGEAWFRHRGEELGVTIQKVDLAGDKVSIHLGKIDTNVSRGDDLYWNEYRFEGQMSTDGTLTGTCHGIYDKKHTITGKVSGRLISEAEFNAMNPLDPAQDFPSYRGAYSDWRVRPHPYELVDDLHNANLLWKSDPTPPGRWGIVFNEFAHLSKVAGGGTSPILYDGKIYQFHIKPSGPDVDAAWLQKFEKAGLTPKLDQIRIAADDVLMCIDARSGRTLWRTSMPPARPQLRPHVQKRWQHDPVCR
jgi:hypothetical protein